MAKKLTDIPQNYVAVDCETTGFLGAKGEGVHRVCEIALAEVKDGEVVATFETLINPCRPLSYGAARVNGLLPAHFAGKPLFGAVLPEIAAWLDGSLPVLAQYAPFDRGFLEHEFNLAGAPAPACKWIDVKQLSQERLPGLSSYSQTPVAASLGIDILGAHRAGRDVQILIGIVEALRKMAAPADQSPPRSPAFEVVFDNTVPPAVAEPVAVLAAGAHPRGIQGAAQMLAAISAPAAAVAAGKWALALPPEAPAVPMAAPFDATKFALAAKATLAPLAAAAKALVQAVGAPVVASGDDSDGALAAVGVVRELAKKAEAARKALLEPLGKPKADVEKYARDEIAKPLQALEAAILQAREDWLLRQRQALEAEAAAAAEAAEQAAQAASQAAFDARQEQAAQLAAAGDAAGAAAAEAAAFAESEAVYSAAAPSAADYAVGDGRTATATATAIEALDFEIEVLDAAQVPDQFCYRAVDVDAVLAHVRATAGKSPVAGVLITPRIRQSVRRR